MGGKGAKERRRLQRLGTGHARPEQRLDVSNNRSPVSPAHRKDHFSRANRANHTRPKSGGHRHESLSIHNQQKRRRSDPSAMGPPKSTPPAKKKEIKKPKHLKRKLEQLGETDTEGKERLLKELSDFEKRKSALSSSPQSGVAHAVKRLHATVSSEPVLKQDDLTKEPAPFPRTVEQTAAPSIPTPNQATLPPSSSTSQAQHESPDSESDVSLAEETKRQRGRRRRGRQETSKKAEEAESDAAERRLPPPSGAAAPPKSTAAEAGTKSIDTRRCIGRKPVTDFSVGQRYPGKVVYTKPFGVFIDIGCHSDAFCHVSRLRDTFVDNVSDVLKAGDSVNPRVVEINRKEKRITVSLQSDARIEDERNSVEARRERKEKRSSKKTAVVSGSSTTWKRDRQQESKVVVAPAKAESETPTIKSPATAVLDEANMTPAELKRARKLARRAARRAQKEETGVAA